MKHVYVHVKVSWKVSGVFDTIEKRTSLPSALGHTLQCLLAHRTMHESSLGMGIGLPDLVGGGVIQGRMPS